MKKLFLFSVAAMILSSPAALAQTSTKSDDSKLSSKTSIITGKVSNDAVTVTDDKDVHWTVTNPIALGSLSGQNAVVKCHLYKGENKIQVTSAVATVPNATVVAYRDTSAFRR
jgi:hypothetical protein